MIVKDIINSTYVLLDNASEAELDLPIVLEQFGSIINLMKYEKILGNLDDVLEKETIVFSDSSGIAVNSITNFGDVIYLEFNNVVLEECPVSMLDMYYEQGTQRVAFWEDASSGTKYAQLAIPTEGTLKVWHEPDVAESNSFSATVEIRDSLKWCLATRLASVCAIYVKFEDPLKMANRVILKQSLDMQAKNWKDVYLELVNRIGTNRPYARLPFRASITNE